VFGAPRFDEDEISAVVEVLRSGWVGTGPRTAEFERAFERYIGSGTGVAVSSCTAALHLAMKVLDLPPDSEVITTPLTFAATANAIIHAGCRPVFADINRSDWNLDPEAVEAAITERTRAVIPVHLHGRPCNIESLAELARRHNLYLIYDAAHAIEAEWEGRKVGCFGDISCYSFYVTKNVTMVEGGILLTQRPELADRLKVLALHGLSKDAWKRFSDEGYRHYQVVDAGFKYNLTDLHAVLGIKQLEKVEKHWKRRQEIWSRYCEALGELPLEMPAPAAPNTRHAYHLFAPLLKTDEIRLTRDELLDALTREGIGVGVHYVTLHLQPFYQERFGCRRGSFPNAEHVSDRTFSLPLSPFLSSEDVDDVTGAMNRLLKWHCR